MSIYTYPASAGLTTAQEATLNNIDDKTTQPTKSYHSVGSFTGTSAVYYTVVSVSGKGILTRACVGSARDPGNLYIKITIDGSAYVLRGTPSVATAYYQMQSMREHHNYVGAFQTFDYCTNINFKTSLKVEVMQSNLTTTVAGLADYVLE